VSGERLKIMVAGMVAGDPHQGGATWAVLQYAEGLAALGHEVLVVEPVAPAALAPAGAAAAYFRSLRSLTRRSALLSRDSSRRTLGLPYRRLEEFAAEADLLLNLSGMLRDERLLEAIPVRAFVDLDPGFNQVWAEQGFDLGLDRHTHCVTVGSRVGAADCPIPTLGREWIATLPPVALDRWSWADGPGRTWTTVGNWRSYGSPTHAGLRYGQRAHSLRELVELPRRSAARFELALAIHPDETADVELLAAMGWDLVDPLEVAGTPGAYAEFVRGSRGELGVAKQGYVASRSGWFSDRSACYLASGRPVVAQDTGFGAVLPTGEGLLAFADAAGAAAAVAAVEGHLDAHRRAARELAVEHLDAARVLRALLERLAVPEPSGAPR
jgi:glycosyltransferase involved in cell wall biosynthesis